MTNRFAPPKPPPRPAQRRSRKSSDPSGGALVGLGCLTVLVLLAVVLTITTLVIWLGWNLGVVALVAASGGSVSKIGFWTAFGIALLVNVLRGIFTSNVTVSKG